MPLLQQPIQLNRFSIPVPNLIFLEPDWNFQFRFNFDLRDSISIKMSRPSCRPFNWLQVKDKGTSLFSNLHRFIVNSHIYLGLILFKINYQYSTEIYLISHMNNCQNVLYEVHRKNNILKLRI